jgi:hypothetical protein
MSSQVSGSPVEGVGVCSIGPVVTVARGVCVVESVVGGGEVVGLGEPPLQAVRESAASSAQTARGVRLVM